MRRFRRVVHGSVERRDVLEPKQLEGLASRRAVRGRGHPERVPRRRSIAAVAKAFVGAAHDPNLVHGDVLVETRLEPRAVARVVAVPHRFAVEPGSAVGQGLALTLFGAASPVSSRSSPPPPRHLVRDTRGVVHRVHERGVLDARPLGAVALFDGVVKVVRALGAAADALRDERAGGEDAGKGGNVRVDRRSVGSNERFYRSVGSRRDAIDDVESRVESRASRCGRDDEPAVLDRFARVRGIVLVVDARIDRAVRAVALEAECRTPRPDRKYGSSRVAVAEFGAG